MDVIVYTLPQPSETIITTIFWATVTSCIDCVIYVCLDPVLLQYILYTAARIIFLTSKFDAP